MSQTQAGEAQNQDGQNRDEQNERDEQQDEQGEQPGQTRNSVLEWAVAGLGFVLVVFAVGFMAFQAFTSQDLPPNIELHVVSVQDVQGGYLALLEARNRGDEAAAEVGVEGTIERNGQEVETSETTFDFIPSGSVREGGLFFTEDPRGALTVRSVGYREP